MLETFRRSWHTEDDQHIRTYKFHFFAPMVCIEKPNETLQVFIEYVIVKKGL